MISRLAGITFHSARRLTSTAIVAVLLFGVLASAPAQAGDLSSAQARLRELRNSFSGAESTYKDANWRWEVTSGKLTAARDRLARTKHRLAHTQWLLNLRMRHMYRVEDTSYVDVMLGATDFTDFISGMDFLARIGRADSDLVISLKRDKQAIRRQTAALGGLEAEQRSRKQELARRASELESQLAAQKEEYQRLATAAAMERRAQSISGRGAGRAHTPNGFVFPVAGPHSFSDDWGNPRSGGRTHEGTDIFAARGTPCVAVVSGSVEARTGGLGGNAIWLHGSDGNDYYYAHLNDWAVTSGSVSAGQVIAYVGNTGNAAGGACHLHFGIQVNGSWVDPYPTLAAAD